MKLSMDMRGRQSVSQSATGTMKLFMNMPVSQSVSYSNNEVVHGYASQSVSYRNNEVVYEYASQSVSQSAIGTMKLSMDMRGSQSVSQLQEQ